MNKKVSTLFIAVCLVACGKTQEAPTSTQVAAKVDKSEISILQINQVMKSAGSVTSENAKQIRLQVLEKLIEQQLLLNKAVDEKVDRTPEVLTAIEAAKREIITQAYVQNLVAKSVKVSNIDIKKYFDAQPGLFTNRKIYAIQDVGVEKKDGLADAIMNELANRNNMAELTEWLKSQDIKFSAEAHTKPAEQLPLDILAKLSEMKDGAIGVFETGNAIHAIKVIRAESAPIDLATATPFIKSYLTKVEANKLVADEVAKFRKVAQIEYMGEFSAESSNNKSNANDTNGKDTLPKLAQDPSVNQSAIDKGVAGLK